MTTDESSVRFITLFLAGSQKYASWSMGRFSQAPARVSRVIEQKMAIDEPYRYLSVQAEKNDF